MSPDVLFWSDPTCIQCRAAEWLSKPDEYRAMLRKFVENGDTARMVRFALISEESRAQILHEALTVGYRKGRVELNAIMLDPHECGKTSKAKAPNMDGNTVLTGTTTVPINQDVMSAYPMPCAYASGFGATCRLNRGHAGLHDMCGMM